MEFGALTRGPGKIFLLVKADCPEGGAVKAISRVSDGTEIPAVVATKNAAVGEYVLIMPVVYVEQTVSVSVLDANGVAVDVDEKKIGHFKSAFTSKYNTFNKTPGIGDIRNYDEYALVDESHIEVNRISRLGYGEDNTELVYIIVTAYCANEEAADAALDITLFDRSGKRMPIKNVSFFSDTTGKPIPNSDRLVRTIHVSFRKPQGQDWFFIWTRFENDALPQGFICMDKWKTTGIRQKFEMTFGYTGQGGYYEDWFNEIQRRSPLELEVQRGARFEIEPLFSIIVPLYKTPLDFFHEMVDSVLAQTYGKFELLLVNASPEDAELCAAVEERQRQDERIRVVKLEGNMGISLNTNEGIRVAKGEFLSFFDHDDVLEPSILFEYVSALNRYPETDLFYCDEDKLLDGHYCDGFLKSDFSWELLTTNNYVCHLLTVRKSVVEQVELSTKDLDGAQDWDMTMKVAEKARNIFHVRKVLYHWRMHANSTAAAASHKPYTHISGEKAIANHFERIGVKAKVCDGPVTNMHRIDYILPEPVPKVSIIIPTKDQVGLLSTCIDSIYEKSTYGNFEIILVENNSTEDETFAYYEQLQSKYDNLKVVFYEGGFNFSAICNYGARQASGDYLLFLNNDTEVITPSWIERLLGPMQRDEVAVTGAKLLFPDDTIQHVGVIISKGEPQHVACAGARNLDFYFGMIRNARDVAAVTGACLMVSREDYDSIDGFDEEFSVAYNDVDFCLRLREKGKSIIVEPNAELYHYESVSRGYDYSGEKNRRITRELGRFYRRWDKYVSQGDPWYGTNIDKGSAYYGLDFELNSR